MLVILFLCVMFAVLDAEEDGSRSSQVVLQDVENTEKAVQMLVSPRLSCDSLRAYAGSLGLFAAADFETIRHISDTVKERGPYASAARVKVLEMLSNKIAAQLDEIKKTKADIEEQRNQIAKLYGDITDVKASKQKQDLINVAQLYQDMGARAASKILNNTPVSEIVGLYPYMNKEKFALILSNMDPDKAQAVTYALANKDNSSSAQKQ